MRGRMGRQGCTLCKVRILPLLGWEGQHAGRRDGVTCQESGGAGAQ